MSTSTRKERDWLTFVVITLLVLIYAVALLFLFRTPAKAHDADTPVELHLALRCHMIWDVPRDVYDRVYATDIVVSFVLGRLDELSVVHHAPSGNYDRGRQYTNTTLEQVTPGLVVWSGSSVKHPESRMVGRLSVDKGVWYYAENIFEKGRRTYASKSACDPVPLE